jgi:hypothetical protein
MQFAPSKHPKEENNKFLILAAVFTVGSLLLWFLAIASLTFAARCIILSSRIKDNNKRNIAILLLIVSGIVLAWQFTH